VGQDALDGAEIPVLQVAEIGFGHLATGQVVLAGHAQHGVLQPLQGAAAQPELPYAARGVQHISGQRGQLPTRLAVHHETAC
jgi:hypothetical protein